MDYYNHQLMFKSIKDNDYDKINELLNDPTFKMSGCEIMDIACRFHNLDMVKYLMTCDKIDPFDNDFALVKSNTIHLYGLDIFDLLLADERVKPDVFTGTSSMRLLFDLICDEILKDDPSDSNEICSGCPISIGPIAEQLGVSVTAIKIMCAAVKNNYEKFISFIENYDFTIVNNIDPEGDPPLELFFPFGVICIFGRREMAEMFLKAVNYNSKLINHHSLMVNAKKFGLNSIVELLLEHGANDVQEDFATNEKVIKYRAAMKYLLGVDW